MGGTSGESEAKLRDIFAAASTFARQSGGCLLFIDEIDAITPKRDSSARGMERRMVAQLLTCMDAISNPDQPTPSPLPTSSSDQPDRPLNPLLPPPPLPSVRNISNSSSVNIGSVNSSGGSGIGVNMNRVIVIGATTKPDSVDGALRRAGRFDREVNTHTL